jgi:integrase
MKTPRPWYRTQNDTWYVCRHGKQIPLCKGRDNKAEAERNFFRLMAADGGDLPAPSILSVAQVCDLFLDWSQRHNDSRTYQWYKDFQQDFCDACGGVRALDVKPFHVTRWLDRHDGWGDGTRRCAVTAVKRAFNWAEAEGVLPTNPVKKVPKPRAKSRDRILSAEERREILSAIKDQQFKDFVFAMEETGCRPSEVARATAADVDLEQGVWVLQQHKTRKKTGKPRVVYLTPAMVDLTRRLMALHPDGPLFRGPRGDRPFSRNGIRCRFRRLREKLPHLKGVISYSYRHSFATDALANGVGAVEVAELLGHKGTAMLMQHYQHLASKRQHMLRAAVTARSPKP